MARLKGFKKLTNVDDALDIFLSQLKLNKLDSEQISIDEALERITNEDIQATK